MAERLLDLGRGLAIYRFHIDELIEQDVNARSMKKEKFDRLTATIEQDQRLEQLPFVAKTDKGFELVGGHHRARSARRAGLTEVHGIVDETDLPRSKISAKQLAHNAIQGEDDTQLLAKIFASIEDVDARLESAIDPADLHINIPRIQIDDVDLGMRFETVIVMFIPFELDQVRKAAEVVEREVGGTNASQVWLAEHKHFKAFSEVGRRIAKEYDIHTMSTILAKMSEIVMDALGEERDEEITDIVSVRDLMGAFYVDREVATIIEGAIKKMDEDPDLPAKGRWGKTIPGYRVFELLAADYLSGPDFTKEGTDGEPQAGEPGHVL